MKEIRLLCPHHYDSKLPPKYILLGKNHINISSRTDLQKIWNKRFVFYTGSFPRCEHEIFLHCMWEYSNTRFYSKFHMSTTLNEGHFGRENSKESINEAADPKCFPPIKKSLDPASIPSNIVTNNVATDLSIDLSSNQPTYELSNQPSSQVYNISNQEDEQNANESNASDRNTSCNEQESDSAIISAFKKYASEFIVEHHKSSPILEIRTRNQLLQQKEVYAEQFSPFKKIESLTPKVRRRIIKSFISQVPAEWTYWSTNVVNTLAASLHLSNKDVKRCTTIGRIERRFGRPSPITTDFQKKILKNWIAEHGVDKKPNHMEMVRILKELNCSKQQFHDLWKRVRETPGIVDDESKKKLRNWIELNQKEIESLSKEDRDKLQQITGWNRLQLHRQLQILRQGENKPITKIAKQLVHSWLKENDYRVPTTEERDQLEAESKLARRQIDNLIAHYRQIQVPVTAETRLFISNWLRENNNQRPNRNQRIYLIKETGLAPWQLTSLISQDLLSFSAGKMDKRTKNLVLNWLHDNGNRRPTESEKVELLRHTGWNQKQLSNTIRNLRRKLGSNNQESE